MSVVGDFGHWNPAAHPLQPRCDGTRSTSVTQPAHGAGSFRYLFAGDYWFNDDTAGGPEGPNSLIHT
ncbi:hypothetical protein [Streptomyces sp. NPDC059708]|uniref:hypothetical protein n=1 Tax=Streptomyces sp. NPDC059708 TaxID=3346916 RepID=UPI00369FDE8F